MSEYNELIDIFKIQLKKPKGENWAVLGTNSLEDNYPKIRNIILREYRDDKIVFFTHKLSDKVLEIKANPNCSICWHSKKHGVQIQFYGKCTVSKNTDEYKNKVYNFRDYIGHKPGEPLSNIINDNVYFVAMEFDIKEVIALKLGREKHLKYKFANKTLIEVVP